MAETTLVVTHKAGLHARPLAEFVKTAKKYKADIRVANLTTGGKPVDAKSIIALLTLGVLQSHTVHIEASGEDAEEAVSSLNDLIANNFGEAG